VERDAKDAKLNEEHEGFGMITHNATSRIASIMTGLLCVLALLLAGCAQGGPTPITSSVPGGTAQPLPKPDHIVVVMEENHTYGEIIGSSDAPYINSLAKAGANFTDAHGVAHPSEPNYLAIFAGSTFGLASDDCPQTYSAANLGSELLAANKTFIGYSESLPNTGFTGCNDNSGEYARKHNPWVDFTNIPASSNQPFTSFPSDFTQLPTVAFVIPNLQDDMHDGSVAMGDSWLQSNLKAYATWASSHNSLLIIAWDEDDGSAINQTPLIILGAHVHPGNYGETVTHYDVLRTIEALVGMGYTGQAAQATTISDIWQA
jgi:hypothetical protein